MDSNLKAYCEARLRGLSRERESWLAHYRDLANFILPRRLRWLNTNASNKGSQINAQIMDPTGTIAARNLAAGMMAGVTSPSRPWLKLRVEGEDTESSNPVSLWLTEVERRMLRVLKESNYYAAKATQYIDLVLFGTAPMIIYEDYEDVIRCYNPAAGEYFVASSDRLVIDTFYREFAMTVGQVVEWFGIENCSEQTKVLWENGGIARDQDISIGHAIEPNLKGFSEVGKRFPFREVYWECGQGTWQKPLRTRGFFEFPVPCPRWDTTGNDSYGRGPAMDALPDIKQLQQETKRKAQAIDKMVNPPMIADVQLKNQPASLIPGGVTYVNGLSSSTPGFMPAYQVQPRIQEMMLDIKEIQDRIRSTFHNDLFLMISQLDTVRSATEIDARREEKLIMLGPVLERLEQESLNKDIERVYSIMKRAGLVPLAPPELGDREIQIEYVSILARSQRATSTIAIEQMLALVGNITAGQTAAGQPPEALDKIEIDLTIDEYSSQIGVSPKLIRDERTVAAIRQARAQQMAKQEQMAEAAAMVEGAQVLSQTDVGGGQNALQAITGL